MSNIVITSLSSTGSGKTTLMVHLAYLLARAGIRVALIELDNRNSLKDCCGLSEPTPDSSTAAILVDEFEGKYPFLPLWQDGLGDKAAVCQAERNALEAVARQLTGNPFGFFRLRESLEKYPLAYDVILVDAPGQQGQLALMALCAATHLIICAEVTQKCISDINALFQWLYKYQSYLKFVPEVVGIVPSRYDHDAAIQRNTLNQFPSLAENLDTVCFSPIRHSPRFLNAYAAGLPIHLDAPGTEPCNDFLVAGNLFKPMSAKRLKGLDAQKLKRMPAIAPHIIKLVKNQQTDGQTTN